MLEARVTRTIGALEDGHSVWLAQHFASFRHRENLGFPLAAPWQSFCTGRGGAIFTQCGEPTPLIRIDAHAILELTMQAVFRGSHERHAVSPDLRPPLAHRR